MAYECQNFEDGQVLTAACLNKMEQALADVCNKDTPFYNLKEIGCAAIPSVVVGKFSSVSFSNKDYEGYDDIVASFGNYNRIKFLIPFQDYGDVVVDTALNVSNVIHPETGATIAVYSYTGSMLRAVDVGFGDSAVFTDVTVYVAPSLSEKISIAFRPTLPDLFSQDLQLTETAKAQARENIGAAAIGEGSSGSSNAVLYTEQTLTEEQKAQARANIGAGTGEGNTGASYEVPYFKITTGGNGVSISTVKKIENGVYTDSTCAELGAALTKGPVNVSHDGGMIHTFVHSKLDVKASDGGWGEAIYYDDFNRNDLNATKNELIRARLEAFDWGGTFEKTTVGGPTPEFDLVDWGLPAIIPGAGNVKAENLDLTVVKEALANGPVKLIANVNIGTIMTIECVVNAVKIVGTTTYQAVSYAYFNGVYCGIFVFDDGEIRAQMIPQTSYLSAGGVAF